MMKLSGETQRDQAGNDASEVAVWDWPVRLFHWALVVLLAGSWVSAEAGVEFMTWHMRCGYGVLTLLVFRLLWGIWGSAKARFGDFVYGPRAVVVYVRAWFSRSPVHYLGHNPLGGWMVVVLLLMLLFQVATGLFANDDIFNEGPLYPLVSKGVSDLLTTLHKWNFNLLLVAVAAHVGAVLLYWLRGENLIKAMFTGRKSNAEYFDKAGPSAPLWLAGLSLVAGAGAVWLMLTLVA
ncbi:MAG: cytochrome b/b6 domain-containing protein [Immundisolibacter sp.]|uniref:cytochrome b/b6 domain-containing protein n=1 Tax=Immundisolibacter sp. TaxID=1934948 RepID=UPI003EDEA21B